MDFSFDETERQFAEAVRRFALERLAPEAAAWDRGERFPRALLRELGTLGVTGLRVPVELGGVGGSYVLAGVAAEELGRGDNGVTTFLQLSLIAGDLLGAFAGPTVQQAWLPGLASGEKVIAFALTEPDAGSDAAAIRTTARRDGDAWVVDGEKVSITGAGLADAAIVFARTGGAGARGIGALLVPLDREGVGRRLHDGAGERVTERGALVFEGVRVPADHVLGDPSEGFVQAMTSFDYNRAIIALCCIGTARQSLDETIAWTQQRHTFGKPLATRQAVAFQIAEHHTLLEAARRLAYDCLARCDRGEPHTTEAAMVKWLGPKVAAEALHACILLHGWMGYERELPHERRLRDVIGLEIGDGTPEIMKAVVARSLFGSDFSSLR